MSNVSNQKYCKGNQNDKKDIIKLLNIINVFQYSR